MENPEEILHSLEEFAKMKPKDIPRELEEYLKFVAKTGDPVYQWASVKSLFREKLVNVITEFYESCSSVEIPPCPNVEMFNYELMKNFILEKLDTFASAPFTLQRICELLTSPRKEYTRIDKYMRALEKNILVVSTMEPGGRRTENGDGVMNGIESDHEHVPEPGNEINVEEMDDTPSWHQNIQTNNHVSEPITFENPENEYHVSSTNQEIVCVQYVSVEPLQSSVPQVQSEDTKDDNISVTITSVDKKDTEIPGEPVLPNSETQQLECFPKEPVESSDKPAPETETEPKIDPQSIKPADDALKDTSKDIDGTQDSLDPLTESILSQPTPIAEPSEIQAVSLESESIETENISPDISVTSTESSPPSETLAAVLNIENVKSLTADVVGEKLNIPERHENKKMSETDIVGSNSSSEASKDFKFDSEEIKETEVTHSNISEVQDNEVSTHAVEDTPKANIDSSKQDEKNGEDECNTRVEESSKIEISNEVIPPINPSELNKVDQESSDRVSTSEEKTVIKPEVTAEPDSANVTEEKVLPMEVDGVPEELAESNEKEKPVLEKDDTLELPV